MERTETKDSQGNIISVSATYSEEEVAQQNQGIGVLVLLGGGRQQQPIIFLRLFLTLKPLVIHIIFLQNTISMFSIIPINLSQEFFKFFGSFRYPQHSMKI